jgi:hypothetical protein
MTLNGRLGYLDGTPQVGTGLGEENQRFVLQYLVSILEKCPSQAMRANVPAGNKRAAVAKLWFAFQY